MNNFILMGAILTFTSIVFGGTDNSFVNETAHLVMCKVNYIVLSPVILIVDDSSTGTWGGSFPEFLCFRPSPSCFKLLF